MTQLRQPWRSRIVHLVMEQILQLSRSERVVNFPGMQLSPLPSPFGIYEMSAYVLSESPRSELLISMSYTRCLFNYLFCVKFFVLKGQFYVYMIFNFRIFQTEIRLNYISWFILIKCVTRSLSRGASKEGSMPVMRIWQHQATSQ